MAFLSTEQQRMILEIHRQPFGIYMADQKVYSHQRSFYRAMSFLEKYEIVFKAYIPMVNKTRLMLTAKGKMFAILLEDMQDKDTGEK